MYLSNHTSSAQFTLELPCFTFLTLKICQKKTFYNIFEFFLFLYDGITSDRPYIEKKCQHFKVKKLKYECHKVSGMEEVYDMCEQVLIVNQHVHYHGNETIRTCNGC